MEDKLVERLVGEDYLDEVVEILSESLLEKDAVHERLKEKRKALKKKR